MSLHERHRPLLVALSDAGGVQPAVRTGFGSMIALHIERFAGHSRRGQQCGFVASDA
ncbi:hypothetical protein DSM112329_05382 [Paraconexibacter sp. AEG42_29]|uniref:Uncharacterized protein n=2 Tax=Paraconexibacter sp. AEG42_29 TaxID=2997339 RepID=A0AAU7B3L8_9ACTN